MKKLGKKNLIEEQNISAFDNCGCAQCGVCGCTNSGTKVSYTNDVGAAVSPQVYPKQIR